MELIISVAVALLLFLCFILGYTEGLRLGMRGAKGIEPKPARSPVTVFKEAVAEKKAEVKADAQAKAYDAFERHDGYTDTERAWIKGGGKR